MFPKASAFKRKSHHKTQLLEIISHTLPQRTVQTLSVLCHALRILELAACTHNL